MPTDIRTKEDVMLHSRGYGGFAVPSVNVKVYGGPEEGWRAFREYEPDADPRFTEEWVEENVGENGLNEVFWMVCGWGWEDLQMIAEEVWGDWVKVYAEGRSGGWACVDGIDNDVDNWDAVDLAKWRRFARMARVEADDIPYRMISSIYINEFERWAERELDTRLSEEPDFEAAIYRETR